MEKTSNIIKVTVAKENVGLRLDIFLCQSLSYLTRSRIKNLNLKGNIKILNTLGIGSEVSLSYKVKEGDIFTIDTAYEESSHIVANEIPLEILYEDADILVINKPVGLVVHPGAGNYENTLVNGLIHKYSNDLSDLNGSLRPGIVHRLDKDTSGVLLIAKNNHSHNILAKQFEEHSIIRHYRALVWGSFLEKSGTIETLIKRSDFNRLKMAVSTTRGKKAITQYKVLGSYESYLSLVDLKLLTGRTHQIRVHMSHLSHNIVGDSLYGTNPSKYMNKLPLNVQEIIKNLNHQALHAYKLGFIHPIYKEYICIEQKEPQDLLELYYLLNLKNIYTSENK